MKLLIESGNSKPSSFNAVFVFSLVFIILFTVSEKYASSSTDFAPHICVTGFIVYELIENFTSFIYLISFSLPIANPILIPAIERDFENV